MRFTKRYREEQILAGKDRVEKEVILKASRVPMDLYNLWQIHGSNWTDWGFLPARKFVGHDETQNDATALGQGLNTLRRNDQYFLFFKFRFDIWK